MRPGGRLSGAVMSESSEEEGNSSGGGSGGGGGGSGCAQWPVTGAWLEHVLAGYHGVSHTHVLDFRLSQGSETGDTVLSDILAVTVTYTAQPPIGTDTLHLILKLLPQDPFSRFFVTEAQFDLREIKFYTKVVPDLHEFQKEYLQEGESIIELPIPKCYHARYPSGDESPVESVLVLENMKHKGFSVAEFSAGLTTEQAESALAAVAKLHGLSLAMKLKEGKPLDAKYPFLFQTSRATDSYQQLVERGLPQLARFLETRPGLEHIMAALAGLKPNTKELIASLLAPKEPMALITHTDFWCNNLLFREDGECRVLDWQMVTYSRPTNDVALLVVSSLPTQLRRTRTQSLLDTYWKELTSVASRLGIDIQAQLAYSRQELASDFKRSQLLALLLCIGSVDVALGDPLTEQRLVDLLQDLYDEGILSRDVLNR